MSDIFLKLVNMSISAGWIVLAVLLIRVLFKKIPKWINAALWSLVGIRLVLPFSIKSILSLIPSTSTIPQDIAESKAPAINSGFETVNNTVNPVISEVLAPSAEKSISPINLIMYFITAIWIIGIISMLIYTAVSYRKIYLRIREGIPDADNTVLCDRIETPFIMGIIKPKIYIPSNMDREYKEYVTAHETAHIERRDYLWKPLAFAFLTVYWFNPLVWAAYIAFCRDIEFACDERVIKRHGEEYKAPYSEALLNCSIKKKTLNINPLAFGEISVKDRIKNILNYKKPSLWIISASIILCGCLLVAFLTDPVDSKKSENKPDSTEAVVPSDDEKEKLSSEDTSAESEITVSTITSSKAETPVSGSSPAKSNESDEYINERDNFGSLDIKIVKDIKDTLDLRFGEYGVEDIYIKKYYGTYSDGSIVISVGFVDKSGGNYYYPAVAILYPAVYEVSGYVVNYKFYPYVYYKGRVERLDIAFQEGLISAKSIDELFNNNPDVITYNDEIYNEKDNYGDLDKANVYNIKNQYLMYLSNSFEESGIKTELKLSDIFIEKYYGQMYNGKVIVSLSYNGGSDRETIVEKVGEYDYIHKENQGIFVFNKYNNLPCHGWGEVSVERLYRYDVITDSDLKNIFAKFPEFVKK